MCVHPLPKATLGRLPLYLKYLKSLPADIKTVSATAIARALGLGDVQVRKDLAAVSGEGKPKIGYITGELVNAIEAVLSGGSPTGAIIVGAGKLGRALLDYDGFSDYGISIAAAFDKIAFSDKSQELKKPILSMNKLKNFCKNNGIKIGIITVPKEAAQDVCDRMVNSGITVIWSFAPVPLSVPEGITLKREDLALSLAHISAQA